MILNYETLTKTTPSLTLCRPDKSVLCALNVDNLQGTFKSSSYSEITFDIPSVCFDYLEGTSFSNPYYALIDVFNLIHIEDLGYFQIQEPSIESDGIHEIKSVIAYSLEYSLTQRYLEHFQIRCGTDSSVNDATFVNADPNRSIVHLALAKCPSWTIGQISDDLMFQTRSFDIDRTSIYDFLMNDLSEAFSCIVDFDTVHNQIHFLTKEDAYRSTGIRIDFDNLLKNVSLNYSADNIKTCLSVYGSDDMNIRSVNHGSNTLINLNYFLNEKYMNQQLIDHYNEYTAFVDTYGYMYEEIQKYAELLQIRAACIDNNRPDETDTITEESQDSDETVPIYIVDYYSTYRDSLYNINESTLKNEFYKNKWGIRTLEELLATAQNNLDILQQQSSKNPDSSNTESILNPSNYYKTLEAALEAALEIKRQSYSYYDGLYTCFDNLASNMAATLQPEHYYNYLSDNTYTSSNCIYCMLNSDDSMEFAIDEGLDLLYGSDDLYSKIADYDDNTFEKIFSTEASSLDDVLLQRYQTLQDFRLAVYELKERLKISYKIGNVNPYDRPIVLKENGEYDTLCVQFLKFSDFNITTNSIIDTFAVTTVLPLTESDSESDSPAPYYRGYIESDITAHIKNIIGENPSDFTAITSLDIYMGAFNSGTDLQQRVDKWEKQQKKIYDEEIDCLSRMNSITIGGRNQFVAYFYKLCKTKMKEDANWITSGSYKNTVDNFLEVKPSGEGTFSTEELHTYNLFLIEDTYSDDNFQILADDNAKTQHAKMNELKEYGKQKLHELCSPQLEMSLDMANLFALADFQPLLQTNLFALGNYILIYAHKYFQYKVRIDEISLDFENPDQFQIAVSNIGKEHSKIAEFSRLFTKRNNRS